MYKNKIYIISGYAKCGKTSAEKYVNKNCKKYNIHTISSIDFIKQIAYRCFGWDGEKDDKSRELLSDLKLAANNYNHLADRNVSEKIKLLCKEEKGNKVFFVDIREPYFIEDFKKVLNEEMEDMDYSVETILIERPDTMDMYECATLKGVYSGCIPDMYDYYIQTNDLDQLCQIMNDIVEDKYIN